ncbi:hypothetical protein EPA93_43210 [Ktedonosporobacter rubrisoli]|uniref:DUF1570 domain-containing protein n=1 Tax=Ktedonosporobacter rubrisoli TaxID=2509675 RepID=A0A4P6K315_KTERU|nr:hypothetical protein [Ktedonosporobacter rubrisoli]QBD82425.1 hypothetical protein EPA93_43210 [Ktedonosporobacter rubrisoli]
MKQKRSLLLLMLLVLMLLSACAQQAPVQKPASPPAGTKDTKASSSQLPQWIKLALPGIARDLDQILIKNADKLWPHFLMQDKQILLVSNLNQAAYLINSQNAKIARPNEVVEYATTSLPSNLLTTPFSPRMFNDRVTYVFNVDLLTLGAKSMNDLHDQVFRVVVHEATHYALQPMLEKGGKIVTLEDVKAPRVDTYPIPYSSRRARAQMWHFYHEALVTTDSAKKKQNIQFGNYFFAQYLQEEASNRSDSQMDIIEGQARYMEFRALALLHHPDASSAVLNEEAAALFASTYTDASLSKFTKQDEYYEIGAAAFALMLQMNFEPSFTQPDQFLLDHVGSAVTAGDTQLDKEITSYYEKQNQQLKATIDQITSQWHDKAFVRIKIPQKPGTDKKNRSEAIGDYIACQLDGQSMWIETIFQQEIEVGDSRIRLSSVKIVAPASDRSYLYTLVPRGDLEIQNGELTIRTDQVQMYNARFQQHDGVYEITA